jgi:hypothetical protein
MQLAQREGVGAIRYSKLPASGLKPLMASTWRFEGLGYSPLKLSVAAFRSLEMLTCRSGESIAKDCRSLQSNGLAVWFAYDCGLTRLYGFRDVPMQHLL